MLWFGKNHSSCWYLIQKLVDRFQNGSLHELNRLKLIFRLRRIIPLRRIVRLRRISARKRKNNRLKTLFTATLFCKIREVKPERRERKREAREAGVSEAGQTILGLSGAQFSRDSTCAFNRPFNENTRK